MTLRVRLVRNSKLEAYQALDHRPTWWAPLFDVEIIDDGGIPTGLLAIGANAEQARAVVARFNAEVVE